MRNTTSSPRWPSLDGRPRWQESGSIHHRPPRSHWPETTQTQGGRDVPLYSRFGVGPFRYSRHLTGNKRRRRPRSSTLQTRPPFGWPDAVGSAIFLELTIGLFGGWTSWAKDISVSTFVIPLAWLIIYCQSPKRSAAPRPKTQRPQPSVNPFQPKRAIRPIQKIPNPTPTVITQRNTKTPTVLSMWTCRGCGRARHRPKEINYCGICGSPCGEKQAPHR